MKNQLKGIGGPLGQGDFTKGRRLEFLLKQVDLFKKLGLAPAFELKAAKLGDWVEEVYKAIKPYGGMLFWHLPNGAARELGNPDKPISDDLSAMAEQAREYKELVDLKVVTIHCAPAMVNQSPDDAGWERYDSTIDASTMLEHIKRQVQPLKDLNNHMGGILDIENVDIANFNDQGFKLPNHLELQTGCWYDLIWLMRQTGVGITFDPEHYFCGAGFLMRQRVMADLPTPRALIFKQADDEWELSEITGYLLRKGNPPVAKNGYHFGHEDYMRMTRAKLIHYGASVQPFNDRNQLDTHVPFDEGNPEQMKLLDMELKYMLSSENCLGGVVEVVGGGLYVDDPGNKGHNRYAEWSPRPDDDEEAKEQSILTILNRIEKIRNN